MRKINRSVSAMPAPLRLSALFELNRDLKRHFDLPRNVRHGRRAPFERERLLDPEVVDALRRVFQDRCAYCESRVSGVEDNIDHFRPITLARDRDRPPSPDHYGWFAYEWRNLLIVCPDCRRAKDTFFPLDGPPAPVLCSWAEANQLEDPQLLDPTVDDPLLHLTIRYDGQLLALTQKGEITLKLLRLNREGLQQERARQLQKISINLGFMLPDDRSSPSQAAEKIYQYGERGGIAMLFLRAVVNLLPTYHRLGQRGTAAFLRALPDLAKAVPDSQWDEAREAYRRGEYPDVASVFQSIADIPMEWHAEYPGASARVRSITIRNFKGVKDLTLDFTASGESSFEAPCAMLLGENATGKSTVLQALCLALLDSTQRSRLRLDAQSFLSCEKSNWRLINPVDSVVEIKLDDGLSADLVVFADRPAFFGPGIRSLLVLAYGSRRYFAPNRAKGARSDAAKTLFNPTATIPDPTIWLQRCTPEQFDAVSRAMFEVLALERDDQIFRDDDGNVLVRAHGRETPISRLSDGYKSLFAMAVDVMCRMVEHWGNLERARGLVLVDEIETHLHPRWKMQVMGALRRALPQVQFIVTTHDPLCLRGMRDGEVHVLYKNAEGDIDELSDLPSVQGLRAEQLLTSDYFGLASTSDPEIERLLDQYVSMSTEATGALALDDKLRAALTQRLSEMTVVGDDASQQVVAEALARYLAQRRTASPINRKTMREEAIRAVLEVLNTPSS